jgi:hypothetical protein
MYDFAWIPTQVRMVHGEIIENLVIITPVLVEVCILIMTNNFAN